MLKPRHWLTHFFDDAHSLNVDKNRRLYSYYSFSYFGIVTLIAFSLHNYLKHEYITSIITFCCGISVLANLLYYYWKHNLGACCIIGSFLIVFFMQAIVYHGGIENTALYWTFPFPLILYVLLGRRLGLWLNIVMFLLLTLLLSQPDIMLAQYSTAESLRCLASLFVVNVISYINEHYREKSHSIMAELNINKEQQANTDALTQLPNRRFVDSVFLPACQINTINSFPMVIVMADVDHFKRINDSYGHDCGDVVLKELAQTIEQSIRSSDIVARVGGEEFLLLFSNSSYGAGKQIAEKIRLTVADMQITHERKQIALTMSFGLAIANSYTEIENKLREADKQLYKAKNSGRNCIY